MRAERAGTDVTGCSRTSTGRMISEPLQLDILTIEQQHRRNTEQQENKCFSGTGSGSRYRDHSREGRVRKSLFISGWGYSCRKYSAFTGGRTEGQKRFILWLWDCLRWFYLGKIREQQENRNRIRRNQISRRGRGAAGDRGAFNLEGACYFRYCLNVVCFYTDLKMKILKWKLKAYRSRKGVTEMDTPPRNVSRVNEFSFLLIELYKKNGTSIRRPIPYIHSSIIQHWL